PFAAGRILQKIALSENAGFQYTSLSGLTKPPLSGNKTVNNTMINPFTIVSPDAQIGENVIIGPFSLIESGVSIGSNCVLDSHTVIKTGVTIGKDNRIGTGSVIGGLPQHISAPPPFGQIKIGDGNVFRENTTVHRSLKENDSTVIGDGNYLMAGAHVAHDCKIGNHNILVNNVLLGGHVTVGHRVNIGGGSAIHQFCRIGSLAMVGGLSRVIQDVPPFMMVDGTSGKIVGLNQIGLRRNGRTTAEIRELKAAYLLLYRSGYTWNEILASFQEHYSVGTAAELTQFLQTSKRGILRERSRPHLRVMEAEETANESGAAAIIRVNAG
ncbi:MAG: acyl-ACP--UDP-N-acetylglucosamine O-acyltransferase, partial [Planctomycetaceae bacterium]|nr:acyl-ACP--UDP-N-acetylglucosamine O-acyltransferase [Planctomycetaceae bacterium]